MPFPEQIPRLFSRSNVEALNPNQVGVYGLLRGLAWIYVGKGDIRQRLLDHLNGDNPCITKHGPAHWVEAVILGDPSAREKALILELDPICNRRIG